MSPFCRLDPREQVGALLDPFAWALRHLAEAPGFDEGALCGARSHRDVGGLWTPAELARELQCPLRRARQLLAEWTDAGRVLPLLAGSEPLLPAFQIDLRQGVPHPAVATILVELSAVFANDRRQAWFVTPNVWIGGSLPALLVASDPRAAVGAARADRYLAQP